MSVAVTPAGKINFTGYGLTSLVWPLPSWPTSFRPALHTWPLSVRTDTNHWSVVTFTALPAPAGKLKLTRLGTSGSEKVSLPAPATQAYRSIVTLSHALLSKH